VTAEELLARAAACRGCGQEHAYRWISPYRASWASEHCSSYRPYVDIGIIAQLRSLVTGDYADPWLPSGDRPGADHPGAAQGMPVRWS
jgi:hypothetical protein